MIGVLTTGLTGVNAHQQWLDNIADNVANVNSDGFKKNRTTFADLISNSLGQATAPSGNCTMGGTNPKQVGTGVGAATMEVIHTQGATKATDNATDLALAGDGFFVVNGGEGDFYTRNGNFSFDAAGNLTYKANGFKVQGWGEDGVWGDIIIDMNDIMAPAATTEIDFSGEINKGQAQGIEDVALDNGNTLKFKKVLGTDETYNYYPVDADGNSVVATASSSQAADITLSDAAGTITVNGEIFYLNNYNTLEGLMAAVETATGVDMNYKDGILSVAAATALDNLSISETGNSLMGVKIDTGAAGRVQDYFDGSGTIEQGSLIGTVDGRVAGGTVDGTSEGIMVGVVGTQDGRTATATGEIIGNLEGAFDGEGMAVGAVKKYEGYLKGDVGALDDDADIATPTTNAWIDGEIVGTSIGSLNGAMKGYLDTTAAPGAGAPPAADFLGDFKINGHTVGFAQADTEKGVYGTIIGDAGVSDATNITAGAGLGSVTINGPGKIQGSVGGDYVNPTGTVAGAQRIEDMIPAGVNPTLPASYDNRATLGNVKVNGAVFGTLSGKATGEIYQWDAPAAPGAWSYVGQVYDMDVNGVTGAVIGTFEGDVDGIAQGDINMDDTSTVKGVVTGVNGQAPDNDGNGIADAYIDIDLEGSLVGDFEGQVDIYGQIFADEDSTTPDADWVKADFDGSGWAQGQINGDLEGTVDGEAHGEINGLIKHAGINAQHFIGHGATMEIAGPPAYHHLNIRFEGTATGYIAAGVDMTVGIDGPDDIIEGIITGLTTDGAYINGKVEGLLDVDAANQYLLGVASGTTDVGPAGSIEGRIAGNISSTDATLEGNYDGYFAGTGEVEGSFEGTLTGAGSFEGEMDGTITGGHMVGYAEGFVENAGPVSGMVDLDGVTFNGTFRGKVELADATEIINGSLNGKMNGTYEGQIDAEKKEILGLFSAANVETGDYAATGGQIVLADGQRATVAGEQVTANENYKINTTITVYDQLGQATDLVVTLENIGDNEWNVTTSDGGAGKLSFDAQTGQIVSVDYDGQYELDLDDIVQVTGINEIILSGDGNAKGHLVKDSLSVCADGTISAMYDNDLSKNLGQVAVATFNNPAGLEKAGGATFAVTQNSGAARVEEAGSIRSGSIRSNALEASNVNLTEELANMILAQQAFTAGIRMITTGDRLITEVMRMRP